LYVHIKARNNIKVRNYTFVACPVLWCGADHSSAVVRIASLARALEAREGDPECANRVGHRTRTRTQSLRSRIAGNAHHGAPPSALPDRDASARRRPAPASRLACWPSLLATHLAALTCALECDRYLAAAAPPRISTRRARVSLRHPAGRADRPPPHHPPAAPSPTCHP